MSAPVALNGKAKRLRDRLSPAKAHIRWKSAGQDWVTVHAPLGDDGLRDHAAGRSVLGTYPAVDGVAREGIIDFDLHLDRDPAPEEVRTVEDYAKAKLLELQKRDIDAALLRHHPYGSYHIRFFTNPIGADRLGRWLKDFVSDAGGIDVDTFPSPEGGGNAVRLPGRHHKRTEYWTELRNGESWDAWPAAVEGLLHLRDNDASLFPDPGKPKTGRAAGNPVSDRPGDLFNLTVPVEDVLSRSGWTHARESDDRTFITRPGKSGGVSASIKGGTVWVYTSSVPGLKPSTETGTPYTAFALVAYLEYGGDFSKAAKALAAAGFSPAPVIVSFGGGHSVNCVRDWPDPVPLSTPPDVPAYPVEVLPLWLREWAAAVATELQVPVDLPAALGLGLVSGGIARRVVVRPRPGFVEPTNVYAMCALPPGERKTQTLKKALCPVLELERELVEEAAPGIAEAESELRIAEKRVKHLEEKISKTADPAEKEDLQSQLKDARDELLKIEVPARPLLYTEDDTAEALKQEIVRQGGRLMVATSEAKCLENITLYSERPNFDVYLKAHAGDELRTGRISRGRESVTDPALTCLLAPQPEVLRGLAENDALRGRGFLARWLYQMPESRVGARTVGAPAVPDAVQHRYHERVKTAWQTRYITGDFDEERPHTLTFDKDARREFEDFERWLEPQLAHGQPLSRLASWANKLNGACARLAAALHVADALEAGTAWDGTIAAGVVRRAVRVSRDYYVPHAIAAFDLMGANQTLAGARKVWAWACVERKERFSKRDAMIGNRAAFETVDDLQPCLDLLERHHLVRQETPPERTGRGRPASPVYEVNPKGRADDPARDSPPEPDPPPAPPRQPDPPAPAGESPLAQNSQNAQNSVDDPPEGISVNSVGGVMAPAAHSDTRAGPRVVHTAAGVGRVVEALRSSDRVGLDIETTGLSHARDRARLLSLATHAGTFLVDLFRVDASPLWGALAAVEVVGHNLGFDLPFLMRLGFVPGRVADTMLASQVLDSSDFKLGHSLKELAHRHLGVTLDKEMQTADWSGPLSPAHLDYAARDAELPLRLWEKLTAEIAAAGLTAVAHIEMAALPAVAWAAVKGVGFDRAVWEALAAETEAQAQSLRDQLDAMAPNPGNLFGVTNWNSPDEVKAAFRALGVDLDSTDDEILAVASHPAADLLREYRAASKLSGTYGREWLRHVAPDGQVYGAWRQIGAGASGRMSCSKPNLQQLPRDVRFRRCFVAPAGRALVKADYSQVELRIAAKITNDKRMLDAYRTNEDLHTLTARALLGKAEVTKADRQLAKAVNFGLLYGQGAKGLARYARSNYGVALTEAEAARHRETFFRTYPGLRAWHRSMTDGPVETRTLAGRRRVGVTAFPEKLNTPVQGTGADGLKGALALLWERRAACPDAFPVLLVHDEIVVECDENNQEQAAAWLRGAMCDGMQPLIDPVPVEVEVSAGKTWGG